MGYETRPHLKKKKKFQNIKNNLLSCIGCTVYMVIILKQENEKYLILDIGCFSGE
jgi:hypothetical protein